VLHLDVASCSLLFLGDSEGLSSSAGRLGALSSDLDAPPMTETSVEAHFLHTFKILTESGITDVGNELRVGSVLDTSLSVKEPLGDTVVQRLGEDVRDFVHLGLVELSSTSVEVNVGDLADEVGESSTNTLNNSESEHNLMFAVDVSVLHSQNVSEVGCVF
jgi:hypothetical protein